MRGIRKEYLWAVALSQDTWQLYPSMQCFDFALSMESFFFFDCMMNFKGELLFCSAKVLLYPPVMCVCMFVKARHLTFMYNSKVSVFSSEGGIQFHNSLLVGFIQTNCLHCFSSEKLYKLDKGANMPQNLVLNAICIQFSQK